MSTDDSMVSEAATSTKATLGHLYVVATPIGNLGDMSARAIEILQCADCIAAEDTRHSARLLAHFNINTPLLAYHDHSDAARLQQILSRVKAGESVALISDAGTPLISDPGFRLVKEARDQGLSVVPIPGASAIITALSVAGLPSDRWIFEGFLPAKRVARSQRLQLLSREERTLVFYESTHRIRDCLDDMMLAFGRERRAVLARELTKTYETVLSGHLQQLADTLDDDTNQRKGEFVVLVSGYESRVKSTIDNETERTMRILLEELPTKQAAAIGAKLTGLKKRDLYQWSLSLSE